MASCEITIKNDNTDLIKKASREAIEAALEAMGMQCVNYAFLKCPKDTGRLANSIDKQVSPDEQCVYIGTNVEYAAYVEMGTSRMTARPYIKPAIEEHSSEYRKIAETYLKQLDGK